MIAGGGVAALEAVLALRAHAGPELPIELICPREHFEYRPLLVLEPFVRVPWSRVELARFAAEQGVRLRDDRIVSVDPERHNLRTQNAGAISYQALLVAVGAVASPGLAGAQSFRTHADALAMRDALDSIVLGRASTLAFAVTDRSEWALPLYELALLARAELDRYRASDAQVVMLTAERDPLEMLGDQASDTIAMLLLLSGVVLRTNVKPVAVRNGAIELDGHAAVQADFVFAQPQFKGTLIDGLPHDRRGFLQIDGHCRVRGLTDVYAAGDATAGFPKQGGLAARQADAAADMIMARAGWPVQPEPFDPVLEGVLLTAEQLAALRADLPDGRTIKWHAPTKVVARHLTPYLGTRAPESREPDAWQSKLRLPLQIEVSELLG